MPGTNAVIEILAFDTAADGGIEQRQAPLTAQSEDDAVRKARSIADRHAGVVVLRRDASPAIGEVGPPEVLFTAGTVGDFG